MEKFKSYLSERRILPPKKIHYYVYWITHFYRFHKLQPGTQIDVKQIAPFLKFLSKRHEDWQVNQANDALKLLIYFQSYRTTANDKGIKSDPKWDAVKKEVTIALRLRHRALATERTYLYWLNSFRHF